VRYELTDADAERINARAVRSRADVKSGQSYPAVVAGTDDIMEYDDREGRAVKVGEIAHVHVFLPDHIENVKVEDRSEGERRTKEREERQAQEREEQRARDEEADKTEDVLT
jgi:hypothetical protein